jgi:AraC family transcriptional regulator
MCLSKVDDAPASLMSKAVDFIEDNLKQAITVADMAEAVSFSLYHFCRTFNRVTHHTPYDYLMRRRLSEAALALLQSDSRILDIALDHQFNSPETFSRAFKRMFGIQPNQLRKGGRIESWRLMPRLTLAHIVHINKGPYLKPALEEKENFLVAGITTLVRDDQRAVSELWDWFAQELAAIEVVGMDAPPGPLALKKIPALKWARFIHKGPTRELSLTLDYVYHTWLPKSGQSLAYPWVLEGFGHDFRNADSQDCEREIYIPIQ